MMEPGDGPHVSALFDDLQSYGEFEHPQHLNQRHEPVYTGTDDYADANAYNSNPFVSAHEEAYMGGEDVVYDDFDRELLNRAHNDRSRMAQQGRARLSLPPAGGTLGMHERGPELEHEYREPAPAPSRNIFSQFTYQPSPEQRNDFSDLPSSPALRASQRKQTQPTFSAQWASNEESQQGHISQQPARAPLPKALVRNAPPTVQGIQLVPTRELPDRFRSIFPFPLFNAIQSKSFEIVYNTSDNFVISAPTGSGKTVIFELAILRLIKGLSSGSFKGVYQAPTKALCSERQKDWKKKFEPLGLKVEELTGDTSQDNTREVQTADIIVTTPEKWDSITRKWKDHAKLMQLVKLFLIDEVHMLKEDRGATLEVVVSRMKSVGSEVRFLAVSATVPNFSDIAIWLGRNPQNQNQPAAKERFGEEFRPVPLQKHVVGYSNASNEFGFDGFLNTKLPHVVAKYSQRKPIMVFCFTKKSCEESAKALAKWWAESHPRNRYWDQPRTLPAFANAQLRDFASSGVAFHHAGLDMPDRQGVEKAYLNGDLSVICSTSTLAVGVNLPCHLVIIKNTVGYTGAGVKEYPDLEIMQMLGRAGRPQFDDSAVAVIMARNEKAKKYEQMVSGQEVLESTLHLNLIEHLNAEISLETINDIYSARRWLSGTFLAVRLEKNPRKYNLQDLFHSSDLDEILDEICNRGISELKNYDFVEGDQKMEVTEYGDIMARYCIRFETMKRFLGLVENRAAKTSEILAALSQAEEFKEVRFRQGDKALYKIINTSTTTKFPIQVNLAQPEHKVSLIIQNELGGGDLPANEDMGKQRISYGQDKHLVFQHARRLLRCIVDCALYREDAKTARNALAFCRSLSSRAWDDMPLTMKLLPSIGIASVRKLVNAGIKSIDEIEYNEPHRLEMILGKNPPAGTKLLATVQDFPKLRVGLRQMPDLKLRDNQAVTVNLRAEVGFVNEKPPTVWNKQPVYICVLSETCDGKMVHFRRISAQKLGHGQQLLFSADITDMNQSINCYIMCDDIAGTMKYATLQPELPAHLQSRLKMNISKRRASNTPINPTAVGDEFDDGGIDDEDLETAARKTAGNDWTDIEEYADSKPSNISTTKKGKSADTNLRKKQAPVLQSDWQPTQLENGKWACNHKCKDKNACKHICCREGVDKPPKPPKVNGNGNNSNNESLASEKKSNSRNGPSNNKAAKTQSRLTQLPLGMKRNGAMSNGIERMDLTGAPSRAAANARQESPTSRQPGPLAKRRLSETSPVSQRLTLKKTKTTYDKDSLPQLSFLQSRNQAAETRERNVTIESDTREPLDESSQDPDMANYHDEDDTFFQENNDLLGHVMAGLEWAGNYDDPAASRQPQAANSQSRDEPHAGEEVHKTTGSSTSVKPSSATNKSLFFNGTSSPSVKTESQEAQNPDDKENSRPQTATSSTKSAVKRKPLSSLRDEGAPAAEKTPPVAEEAAPPAPPAPRVAANGSVIVAADDDELDPWLVEQFGAYVDLV
ncbi:ATP-dependent DNA helicase MER3 [Phyllosticta capitalensis]